MRARLALAVPLLVSGCAQIFGIEKTTGAGDAGVDTVDAKFFDAKPCSGGTAAMLDPTYGHCYIKFTAMPVDHATAESNCQLMPGFHLARLETINEQPLVATLVAPDVAWISGNDIATEGTFLWDNGVPITDFHWKGGEPDNGGGAYEEDCIAVDGTSNGDWTDRPCVDTMGATVPGTYPYVCERD